jgi:hypothetical protein
VGEGNRSSRNQSDRGSTGAVEDRCAWANVVATLPLTEDERGGNLRHWLNPEYAPNQHHVSLSRDLLRRLCLAIAEANAEMEAFGEAGEREGYEQAVQEIDRLTGGDGEYRY